MGVTLKKNRNYAWDVPWSVDQGVDGQNNDAEGAMKATFYLPTQKEFDAVSNGDKETMLELVLKGVEGLEIEDGKKTIKDFEDLKPIIIADPEISRAFYDAFMELWAKKTLPATSLMQAQTIMGLLQQEVSNKPQKDLAQQ